MSLIKKSAAMVLAALLLILSACSGGERELGGEVTVDPRVFNTNESLIIATGDTVYFVPKVGGYYILSYMDRASGYAGALCGKPECTHDDADCNAWADGALAMTIWEDRIYWLALDSGRLTVLSVAPDGTDRRTEWQAPKDDIIEAMSSRWLKVDGDHIYIAYVGSKVVDGEYTHPIRIIVIPRDGGEVYDELLPEDDFSAYNFLIFPTEEGLFYCGCENVGTPEFIQHVRLYDPETGETQSLYDGIIPDFLFVNSIWPAQDGLLLGGNTATVYKLRYDTGEIEPFLEIDGIENPDVFLGEDFAVAVGVNRKVNENTEFRVVSFDGEEISSAKYPPIEAYVEFEGYDSEYFYLSGGYTGSFYIIPRDGGDIITAWNGVKETYRKGE